MFFGRVNGWPLEGADTEVLKCEHCGNTAEHFVYVAPKGIQLGVIFMKKPLLGMKKYFLACPVCGYLPKEITKEQAMAMVRRKT